MAISRKTPMLLCPLKSLCQLLLAAFCLATASTAMSQEGYFLIQLGEYSTEDLQLNSSLQNLLLLQSYAESDDNGEHWKLNIGFFNTDAEARKISRSFKNQFPDLSISTINEVEFNRIQNTRKPPWVTPNNESTWIVPIDSRPMVYAQIQRAAELYRNSDYSNAAILYRLLSKVPNEEQAAWALELYGVTMEKQYKHEQAIVIYTGWLLRYPDSSSQPRVQQRLLALNTAMAEPQIARKKARRRNNDNLVYGSASVVYRGMRREIDGQDPETTINSVATDLDLHIRARAGNLLLRSRVTTGYLSDHSDREDSDGRVSNLHVNVLHEPSGAELTLGRLRSNAHGIYGYLDGAIFSYPVTGKIAVNLVGGTVTTSSRESPDSDRKVYALSTDIRFTDPGWQLHLYGVEQTYEGLTERRAVGSEVSYFNDYSHYLFIADYDTEFSEINNLMLNSSWDISETTNLALSLGYQRSPFLTASNALIGEFDLDLDELINELGSGGDIYDAALDKTALNRYASMVINQQLSERLRLIAEVYHYELSDLPVFDPNFNSPDSDASTTAGLQFLLADALFSNDYLSTGLRYTEGDTSGSASLFIDEKLVLNPDINLTLRLVTTQRWIDGLDQDAYTVRPGARLDWYFTPTLLLDMEVGYEWLMQDFEEEDFEVQQGFIVMGLHKRF